jgi:hypothetical protein
MAPTRLSYPVIVLALIGCLVCTANESKATDLLTLGNEVKELQRQMQAMQQELNILKARLGKMGAQPVTRSQEVVAKAPDKAAPLTEAQKQAAITEVCAALKGYEVKIKKYVKMRNPDDMWDKMKKAYFALEGVLKKYEQYKVVRQIDKLTGDVIYDIYQGRLARDSIPGNADFRKAVDRHVKKLREIQSACK